MRKLFVLFLSTLILASVVSAAPPAGLDMDTMQNIIVTANGTNTAYCTIEAMEHQNAIIDKLYVKTDKTDATVWIQKKGIWIGGGSWEAVAITSTREADVYFKLDGIGTAASSTTQEVQSIGTDNPLLPLWIGDKGYALQISSEGNATIQMWVLGRRGTSFPRTPSTGNSRF